MIPMKDIRAFARRIAAEFKPRRINPFGSYAYGKTKEDSAVDYFIEMDYTGEAVDTAVAIRLALYPGYPIDLIIRSPEEVRKRRTKNDWFIREILDHGKVRYEARAGARCISAGSQSSCRGRIPSLTEGSSP